MTKPDGGPAFPTDYYYDGIGLDQTQGMTLRDYFAAQALHVVHVPGGRYGKEGMEMVAEYAYKVADAMIAEREKSQ